MDTPAFRRDLASEEGCGDPIASTPVGASTIRGSPAPLDELLRRRCSSPVEPDPASTLPFVGYCVDTRHPSYRGRALIRWTPHEGADTQERWLPCLQTLALREGDRVLVTPVSNIDEPVVIGTLDGFALRPDPEVNASHVIEMKSDERLSVLASDGTPLIEIEPTSAGPVVHLLWRDLVLETPGKLTLAADSIDLRANRGPVGITASDDVEVNGELIRLNSPKAEADVIPKGKP